MAVHVVFQHALFSCMGKWSWVVKSTSGIHRNSSQTCSGLLRGTVAIGLFGRFFFFFVQKQIFLFFPLETENHLHKSIYRAKFRKYAKFQKNTLQRYKTKYHEYKSISSPMFVCGLIIFSEKRALFSENKAWRTLYIYRVHIYIHIYIFFKQIWAILFIILEVLFSKNWRILHG